MGAHRAQVISIADLRSPASGDKFNTTAVLLWYIYRSSVRLYSAARYLQLLVANHSILQIHRRLELTAYTGI